MSDHHGQDDYCSRGYLLVAVHVARYERQAASGYIPDRAPAYDTSLCGDRSSTVGDSERVRRCKPRVQTL